LGRREPRPGSSTSWSNSSTLLNRR
jgi:hypothetical protein